MNKYCKRLIEVDLPIRRISTHARREKSIRHGHISTLHIWWARRPLAACRAVACATLWPDPADERCPVEFRDAAAKSMRAWADENIKLASAETAKRLLKVQKEPHCFDDPLVLRRALLDFVADFADWDNATVREYLDTSRSLTWAAHRCAAVVSEERPTVLDPFAGGGAFPLEAARIGARSIAYDLNPIPVLLNTLLQEDLPVSTDDIAGRLETEAGRIRAKVQGRLGRLYTRAEGTSVAYVWARTISCEGPGCGAKVPLVSNPWLSRRRGSYVWLELIRGSGQHIDCHINSSTTAPKGAPVSTCRMGSATCPRCGYTTPKKFVYAQLVEREGGAKTARLLALVIQQESTGRYYVSPTEADSEQAVEASTLAKALDSDLLSETINPVSPGKFGSGIASPTRIGCRTFADLFAPRQLLALSAFSDEVAMIEDRVVRLLLACAIDRMADYNSAHCRWSASRATIGSTFGRQAVSIAWTFAEVNPFSGATGGWDSAISWILKVIEHVEQSRLPNGQAARHSATDVPLPDDSVDAVLTDPPYYGAIMYGDLSDFFYVWLKRTVGSAYPDYFVHPMVPKTQEIVATPTSLGPLGESKDSGFFESHMRKALEEARRVVTPSSVSVIVFAHKSTSAWEAMLSALLRAGWTVTASWPIDTEMGHRVNAAGTASLSSSIHIVCRPREHPDRSLGADDIGDWRGVLSELPERIHSWMPRLAKEGIVGADAIFSCLGPAVEIFSRYSSVEKPSGEKVTLSEYLEEVWAAVSREALSMIFEGADATGFEEDARLTAIWLWTLHIAADGDEASEESDGKGKLLRGFSLEYDAARKIAQGLGAHLDDLHHLVEVKGDTATLLSAAARSKYLFGSTNPSGPKKSPKKKEQLALNFTKEIEELEDENAE